MKKWLEDASLTSGSCLVATKRGSVRRSVRRQCVSKDELYPFFSCDEVFEVIVPPSVGRSVGPSAGNAFFFGLLVLFFCFF